MDFQGNSKRLSIPEETYKDSSILNLPIEILEDIFSRVAFDDLYYCRHVCKNWYNMLSNPTFPDTNLIKPPFTSVVVSCKNTIHLLTIGKIKNQINCDPIKPKRLRTGCSHGKRRGHVELVGACNGLLCVARNYLGEDYTIYALNPLLGKLLTLPKPKKEEQVNQQAYGFGFSEASGQFKVLRIVTRKLADGTLKSEGEVCTLREDNTWRKVEDHAPYPYSGKFCSASLHGSIHWLVDDFQRTDYIYSWDIKEEKIRSVPPPPSLEKRNLWMSLGVFDDCLCVFDNSKIFYLELWRMKDYGVVTSWTRDRIRIRRSLGELRGAEFFPITYWRDGRILMASSYGFLFSYDERRRIWTRLKDFSHEKTEAIVYTPSFHSPKDLGHRRVSQKKRSDNQRRI